MQQQEVGREPRFHRAEPTHVVPDVENDSLIVRLMHAGVMPLLAFVPIPHAGVRRFLEWDNRKENARDGWDRLRDINEMGRYRTIQGYLETFASHGSVLDIGCAQGILEEGLRYGRYTGVDLFPETQATARGRDREGVRFLVGDGETYVPDEPLDAVVFNECLYYFRDPQAVIERYAGHLRPGGVVVLSLFDRAWWPRRFLRRLDREFGPALAQTRIISRQGAAWTIRVYRPDVSGRLRG